MKLQELLERLRTACVSDEISRSRIIVALLDLLLWLNNPVNNTNKTCRRIDIFVVINILTDKKWENLPEDIKDILFDMGGTLHDAHSNPEIAKNFESLPEQLLYRAQKLQNKP
jgi:hypothetical protein